jgi:hypothetical protein
MLKIIYGSINVKIVVSNSATTSFSKGAYFSLHSEPYKLGVKAPFEWGRFIWLVCEN